LVDEINLINDRVIAFNIDNLTGNSHQKLEQWRLNYHQIIDDIFQKIHQKIDQRANEKVEKQRDEISKIRSTVTELIRKRETTVKDADLLKTIVHKVEEKINKMEQTCFELVVHPLVLDDSLIHIEELFVPRLHLSNLSPAYKTITRIGDNSTPIASNDRFFLIHQKPYLCLMDQDLTIVKRSRWDHGLIYDMCWSSTLARFFIITKINIFIADENTMSIEPIQINDDQNWLSCTCSDESFYLSTFNVGSSILKFSLSIPIQLMKYWKSPQTCTIHQIISNIVYKDDTLALAILDLSKKNKFIELRSSTTLERLWSLKLDMKFSTGLFRCCFLNRGEWLVCDHNTSRFLHITKDGKLISGGTYNSNPCHAVLFQGDELVISTTNGINFHKIKP